MVEAAGVNSVAVAARATLKVVVPRAARAAREVAVETGGAVAADRGMAVAGVPQLRRGGRRPGCQGSCAIDDAALG